MKSFIAILLYLFVTDSVQALFCYATNLALIKAVNINAQPIVTECNKFFNMGDYEDIVYLRKTPTTEEKFTCYIITAEAVEATISIQGCSGNGTCAELEKNVTTAIGPQLGYSFYTVNCTECEDDSCNAGEVKHSLVFKSRINLKDAFLICVGVGIIGAAIITACRYVYRKKIRKQFELKDVTCYFRNILKS